MTALTRMHDAVFGPIARAEWLLPTLARLIFAGVLLMYFIVSGLTKVGDGALGWLYPSDGGYIQIFPKAVEAAGYDTSQLSTFHWLVAVAGTWAEFLLPVLIVLGLLTRIAALGMIAFVVVQSLTDLYGHGGIAHAETVGAWFDRFPSHLILDQRAFWVFLLLVLVVKGAGPISLDRAFARR